VSDVVSRYRRTYGLGDEIGIEHVEVHRELEERLTRELLASTPESRWRVFSAAYTELYRALTGAPALVMPESAPDEADTLKKLTA